MPGINTSEIEIERERFESWKVFTSEQREAMMSLLDEIEENPKFSLMNKEEQDFRKALGFKLMLGQEIYELEYRFCQKLLAVIEARKTA